MHFLKALGLFILLVSGNAGIALSFREEGNQSCDEQELSPQVSEDISELFDSTLAGPDYSTHSFSSQVAPGFYFQSIMAGIEAERYIACSRFIEPGLDVSDLIFPFHFFL